MPHFTVSGYPWTEQFFEDDLPLVPKFNPKVVNAFAKYSGLSGADLQSAFRPKFEPRVEVQNLPGHYGFTPDSRRIQLDKTFLTELEAALPRSTRNPKMHSPSILEGKVLKLLEATVLHEMVHWARLKFNETARINQMSLKGRSIEERIADAFEKEAYFMQYTASSLALKKYFPMTIKHTGA